MLLMEQNKIVIIAEMQLLLTLELIKNFYLLKRDLAALQQKVAMLSCHCANSAIIYTDLSEENVVLCVKFRFI